MRRIVYPAPLTTTLLSDAQQWQIDEHLQRTKYLNGTTVGVNGYGILDSQDPVTVVSGSSRPFSIANSAGTFVITITGGTAVFGNGEMITLPTIANIAFPTTYMGQRHVVYLVFVEEDHDVRFNEFDVPVPTWTGPPSSSVSYIRIARKVDYDAIGASTRAATTIPLALVTPTNSGLTIDYTRTELLTNRPWATAVDIQHRNYVGSGVVTDQNPHGLAVSDLAVSNGLTLYDFMLPHGVVIARDVSMAGVPGFSCIETVTALAITEDLTGQTTGYAGAFYFSTQKFPTQILKVVGATSGKELACVQVPNRNILMFLPEDEWDQVEDLTVTYITVTAVTPPTGQNLTVFPGVSAVSSETIVAGGGVVSAVVGDLGFSTCGPYPFNTEVYLDGDGYLQRVPATLKCDIALNDISGLQSVDIQPLVPSKLRVGLRSAVANPALDIRIEISGVRVDDDLLVTETVTFGSAWTDSVIPATAENPNQWLTTTTTFSSVDSFQVVARSSDGPNSAITIQALYDANDLTIASDLPVAEVFWDGLRMAKIKDVRPLRVSATSTQTIELAASAASFAESTLVRSTAPAKAILGAWYDDFETPLWVSSDSTILRWSNGIGVSDIYISRPILVRPHLDDALSLRVWPVEPDQGFQGWVRVYTDVDGWSAWTSLSTLSSPKYTYNFTAGRRLIKWQFKVQGPVKGLLAAYLATGDTIPPTMIFDIGVFGIDSLG